MVSLDEWRREQGYALAWWIDPPTPAEAERGLVAHVGGRLVAVAMTATEGGQIVVGTTDSVTDRYTYELAADAVTLLVEWKMRRFEDEPRLWIRHQPSDRRRVYAHDGTYIEEVRP